MPVLSDAEKAILRTIVYYDCLDYPLTLEGLRSFSFKTGVGDGLELKEAAKNLVKLGIIIKQSDFYFLKNRRELVKIRAERNDLASDKWRKALKAIRRLRIVPYIRIIFASGSLALSNTAKESDLDVLIVAKHGRIWTSRFLIALLLSLLGVRRTRHDKIVSDKICLNHFITDRSLYIPRKSIYTAQLYARLVPILWEDEKLIDEFYEANSWIEEYIPNFKIQMTNDKSISKSKIQDFIKRLGEKILDTKLGDWFEKVLKKYQLRRINNYHLTHKPGGRVKADDESLEFHPDSPELKIIERYNQKMIELGFEDLTKKSSFAK